MSPIAEKSPLPITTRKSTRRRPIDSIEVVEEDDDDGGGSSGGDHHHHPFHHRPERAVVGGCCAALRRKMNVFLRVLRPGRKNLSRWIFGAFVFLIVFTIFFKLMLMYSFLEYSSVAQMRRGDFLVRPNIVNASEMHQNVVEEKTRDENGGDHWHQTTLYSVRFSLFILLSS